MIQVENHRKTSRAVVMTFIMTIMENGRDTVICVNALKMDIVWGMNIVLRAKFALSENYAFQQLARPMRTADVKQYAAKAIANLVATVIATVAMRKKSVIGASALILTPRKKKRKTTN